MKEFKSFFKQVGGNEGSLCIYPTRLDTYGCGCQHDCGYCYAKSLLGFRGLWVPEEPAGADIEKIKRKLDKIPPGTVLRLGGMTDCFQPIEKQKRITYETIKAMNERDIAYLIVTKSALVAEYADVMEKRLAHVQISVTATDDKTAARYEKASRISDRIAAIEKLNAAGFDTDIRLSPYIPEFVDIDIINAIDCPKVLVEFLRVNTFIRRAFDVDYSAYTYKSGAYYHLPLEKKMELLARIKKPEVSVCDDVPEHYQYFKEHINHNKDDCCNLKIRTEKGKKMAENKLKIKYMGVDELKVYENNARKHEQIDIDAIAKSIENFGFNDPIGIWHGVIVEGHGRLLAAKKLGMTEVPVIDLDHLTDEQRRAYALAHNKTAELSGWDFDILGEELADISEFDMAELGFDIDVEKMQSDGKSVPLADRFLVPPFSVIYGNKGKWMERKRAWVGAGLRSELGRGDDLVWGDAMGRQKKYREGK